MASHSHKKTWDEEIADVIHDTEAERSRVKETDPRLFKLWDINQKYLFLVKNMLVADVKTNSPEQLMAVLPNTSLDITQKPIFMGLENKNSCLSCVKSGNGQYQLELKEKAIKDLYSDPKNAKAFTFYSKSDGNADTCSFESAEFPEATALKEHDPRLFKLWDIDEKYLFLVNNVLVADVKSSNSPEQLMAVLPNTSLDKPRQPIFMGPENKNSCLSCVKSGNGQYQLELKEKAIKDLYWDPKNAKAFTFYSKSDGNGDTCSFESAEFPGWFLSTSSEAKKPLGLSQKGGPQNVLFYFERKL
ncbi:interleukin-36 receptor antagonist protein-like [Crotalus adamanteus]|uniref:Interleukin-1 n=1 Tax=Crotalus adamanteus TaxID=8729 RepID=A0AAW1AZH3_CROAD